METFTTQLSVIQTKINQLNIDEKTKKQYITFFINNYYNIECFLKSDIKSLKQLPTHYFNMKLVKINDEFVKMLGDIYPKYEYPLNNNILGNITMNNIDKIVDTLNKDGYYVYDNLLDENLCDNIIEACTNIQFNLKNNPQKQVKGIDVNNKFSSTFWASDQYEIVKIPEVQQLITNPIILNICQKYLHTTPINNQTNLWWSVAGENDNTQVFHQDFEDIKFLKIFIYLSDVTDKNGPHTYVKGSRNNFHEPPNYRTSMRVTDNFIQTKYNHEDIKIFTGKKGTIIFEDTNGYHKGSPLLEGCRIMLQLEYCASSRGLNVNLGNKPKYFDINNDYIKNHPNVFLKYL